jgi:hypothetical protein
MNFENLNFNIFNIIIFTGIIHGFIFSFVVLINKKLNSKSNIYLSFTVLALAFSNLQYWFLDTGITQRYQYDNNSIIFIPFEFLILPFFYLFVKSYVNKRVNRTEHLALFSPFVLCVIYLLIRNTINDNLKVIKIFNLIVEYLSICLSLIIIILVFKMLNTHERSNKQQINNEILLKTKWLKRILIIGIVLCIVWFISLNIFIDIISTGFYRFYPLWIGMSILIYWVGYTAILQKQLYNQRTEIRNKLKPNNISRPEINNGISTYTKLESIILKNKMYLYTTKTEYSKLQKILENFDKYKEKIKVEFKGNKISDGVFDSDGIFDQPIYLADKIISIEKTEGKTEWKK